MPIVAGLLLTAWHLLSVAVLFGPALWVYSRWEPGDAEANRLALEAGLPRPKLPGHERLWRLAIVLGVLALCAPVAITMNQVAPALERSLVQHVPF